MHFVQLANPLAQTRTEKAATPVIGQQQGRITPYNDGALSGHAKECCFVNVPQDMGVRRRLLRMHGPRHNQALTEQQNKKQARGAHKHSRNMLLYSDIRSNCLQSTAPAGAWNCPSSP
jgi:hypothetical protein